MKYSDGRPANQFAPTKCTKSASADSPTGALSRLRTRCRPRDARLKFTNPILKPVLTHAAENTDASVLAGDWIGTCHLIRRRGGKSCKPQRPTIELNRSSSYGLMKNKVGSCRMSCPALCPLSGEMLFDTSRTARTPRTRSKMRCWLHTSTLTSSGARRRCQPG